MTLEIVTKKAVDMCEKAWKQYKEMVKRHGSEHKYTKCARERWLGMCWMFKELGLTDEIGNPLDVQ